MNDIPRGAHSRWLEPPEDKPHHPDCPTILDDGELCECRELWRADHAAAKEGVRDQDAA